MDHFSGERLFVLAGSGHIAGVVNPPSSGKYQYWLNDGATDFVSFLESAVETKGSWWPHWVGWLRAHDDTEVPATGARVPGEGALAVIEDAPGRYAKTR
jgi:polyhydroxyalkanoate synthase subunit PhaC